MTGTDPLRSLADHATSARYSHRAKGKTVNKRLISSVRSEVVVLWLIAVTIGAGLVLHDDLTGGGLRNTLMFRSIGYMVYPVFYGCVAYLLFRFGRLLSRGRDYLTAANGSITVGETVLPIEGLSVETRRNFLGLREIVFHRDGQRVYAAKAYFLARPLGEVIEDLKYVLQRG